MKIIEESSLTDRAEEIAAEYQHSADEDVRLPPYTIWQLVDHEDGRWSMRVMVLVSDVVRWVEGELPSGEPA